MHSPCPPFLSHDLLRLKRAVCIYLLLAVYNLHSLQVEGLHAALFPFFFSLSADPMGLGGGQNTQGFFLHQREIQLMISSLRASLRLKAAVCTAPGANLLGTLSLAHVVYTSKSGVKLFQLGPQRHPGRTNLLMKGADHHSSNNLGAGVHYTYSLGCLVRGPLCVCTSIRRY